MWYQCGNLYETFLISEKNNWLYSQNQFPTSEPLGRTGTSFWRSDFWVFLVDKWYLKLVDGFKKSKVTFVLPQRSQKSLRLKLVSTSFKVSRMVAGGAQIAIFFVKRGGGGGGEGEKSERGEKEREVTLSPQSLSLFPFLPIPYPFRRLATIFSEGKTRAEKSVCSPPLQAPGWGILEELCCNWQNAFKKSV